MTADVLEEITCNLCGSDNSKFLYSLRDYRFETDETLWRVVQCRRCGLGYLNPRPTEADIGRFYPENYYEGRSPKDAGRRYHAQLAYVPRGKGRLLDVGTAGGFFLDLLSSRGWTVFGIDRSDAASRQGSEARVVQGLFPVTAFAPASFDCITAWAVFEHLHDPLGAFRECERLLRPNGRVIVQVPNLRSLSGRFSYQEDVPRHLHFFSPRTLRAYAHASGLELEDLIHTTKIFGGSGRGTARVWLFRALRRSVDDYFAFRMMRPVERLRQSPLLAGAWYAVAAVESALIHDRLVERLRVSGQVIAIYRKPTSPL